MATVIIVLKSHKIICSCHDIVKIYIPSDGESLKKISIMKNIQMDELLKLNPQITDPDMNIMDRPVRLPPDAAPTEIQVPVCPPSVPMEYLDQWIPITPIEQMARTDYDVLIVGTGAGGGAALWRLCQQWQNNGKRIGVVEAGDLLLQTNALNIPTLNYSRFWQYLFNPKISKPVPNFGTREVFALGGRTLFWGGVSLRMHPSEIRGWPISMKEMERYYGIAEQAMHVTRDYLRGSPSLETFLDRLRNHAFTDAIPTSLAIDLNPTWFGLFYSNVIFSSISFIAQALNLRTFDLAVKARAVKVAFENGTVSGITVMTPDKNSYFLKAKTVILSANTFQTPRILLNSGIHGSAVGHYLTHHSRTIGRVTVNQNEFLEYSAPVRILIPGTEERPYQIQIDQNYEYKGHPLRLERFISFYSSNKVESRYDNKVTLDHSKRDEYGVPEISVEFSYNEKDISVINDSAKGVKLAAGALKLPLTSVCFAPPGSDFHEMGTCRMGEDPATSATNRYGQIHDVKGLFVADNSIIPTSGTASPTLTTVALAIRTADYIAQQLK